MVSFFPVRHLRDEVLENLSPLSETAVELQRADNLDCECRINPMTVDVGGPAAACIPCPGGFYRAAELGIRGRKLL